MRGFLAERLEGRSKRLGANDRYAGESGDGEPTSMDIRLR
jgi:hypothetical protein